MAIHVRYLITNVHAGIALTYNWVGVDVLHHRYRSFLRLSYDPKKLVRVRNIESESFTWFSDSWAALGEKIPRNFRKTVKKCANGHFSSKSRLLWGSVRVPQLSVKGGVPAATFPQSRVAYLRKSNTRVGHITQFNFRQYRICFHFDFRFEASSTFGSTSGSEPVRLLFVNLKSGILTPRKNLKYKIWHAEWEGPLVLEWRACPHFQNLEFQNVGILVISEFRVFLN